MTDSLRLLAVFAHPDDESMGMGGTLAKYSAEGVETHLVCASRGQRGWPALVDYPGPSALGKMRELELENAVQELGIHGLYFLDYIDGDVDRADPTEAIQKIAAHIRRIMPQVVVTFPPDGNYGHPDHIAVGQFTNAAVVCAADASYQDSENFAPHRVSKLYYMVDSEDFIQRVAPLIGELTFLVDDHVRGEVPWPNWMITTRIEMADAAACHIAWRAVQCHKTQLLTLGALADLDEDEGEAVLAMQGTFYRAFSLVNGGREIEKDLFEGIR